jgi:hypothetical protein
MSAKKDYRWAIYHIKGTPAKFIGSVSAPDEETALKKGGCGAGDRLQDTEPDCRHAAGIGTKNEQTNL